MRKTLAVLGTVLLAGIAGAAPQQGHGQDPPAHGQQQVPRKVDLVIALDTSSSMNGLIDAARQKLWDVVGLLAQAKPQPVLRVGLISYGNSGYAPATGWVQKDSDLTGDLDSVYAKLFALRTNGGEEYVARAVKDAAEQMQWDQDPATLKIVFVAGNEPATQDPQIPLEAALGTARQRNIVVNAIYCGSTAAMETDGWRRVASLGKGEYAAIDHTRSVAEAPAPQDAELARLGGELNRTYIGYGARGSAGKLNQQAQDKNAESASVSAAAGRAMAKSSGLYRADDWDLVDARKAKKVDVKAMGDEELPAELRAVPKAEREAYVAKKEAERAAIQKRIAELSRQRRDFLKTEAQKRPAAARAADDALLAPVKKEAEKAGYAF